MENRQNGGIEQYRITEYGVDRDGLMQRRVDRELSQMRREGALTMSASAFESLDQVSLTMVTLMLRSAMMQKNYFQLWRVARTVGELERQVDSLQENISRLRMQDKESRRRALGVFMGTSSGLVVQSVFRAWSDHRSRVLRESLGKHEAEALRLRTQGESQRLRTIALLAGSQSQVLLKSVLTAWREDVIQLLIQKGREAVSKLRAEGASQRERAIALLAGPQSMVVIQRVVSLWRAEIIQLQKQHAANLQDELLRMKSRGKASNNSAVATLIGSQSGLLLQQLFASWKDELNEKRKLLIEALRLEHSQAKQRGKDHRLQAAMAMVGSQSDLILRSTFAEWKEDAQRLSRDRLIERYKLEKEVHAAESQRRAVAMLAGSQTSVLIRMTFSSWRDDMLQIRMERHVKLQKEFQTMQMHNDKNKDKRKQAAMAMVGSQSDLILHSTFVEWKEDVQRLSRERLIERFKLEKEVHAAESQRRAVAMLAGSQTSVLIRMTFSSWRDDMLQIRMDRYVKLQKEFQTMRIHNDKAKLRAASLLAGSDSGLLTKKAFSFWKDEVRDGVKHMAAQLRHEHERLKLRAEENKHRAAAMLVGSNAGLLVQGVFASWRDEMFRVRNFSIERLKAENLRLKMKADEQRYRSLAANLGSQSGLLSQKMFASWKEIAALLRQERQVERLEDGMKALQAQGAKSVGKAMAMFFSSNSDSLNQAAFVAWREEVNQERRFLIERLKIENLKLSMQANEGRYTAAAKTFSAVSGLLMRETFAAWKELAAQSRQERQVERLENDMKALQAQGANAVSKAMGMFFSSNSDNLIQAAFLSWREEVIQERRWLIEKLKVENLKLSMQASQGRWQAAALLAGPKSGVLLRETFTAWKEEVEDIRRNVEMTHLTAMRQQIEQGYQRVALVLASSQAALLAQDSLRFWRKQVWYHSCIGGVGETFRWIWCHFLSNATFTAWHSTAVELQMSHAFEREGRQTRRAIRLLHRAELGEMLRASFCGWAYECKLQNFNVTKVKLQFLSQANAVAARKAIESLIGTSAFACLRRAVDSWYQLVMTQRHAQQLDASRGELVRLRLAEEERLRVVEQERLLFLRMSASQRTEALYSEKALKCVRRVCRHWINYCEKLRSHRTMVNDSHFWAQKALKQWALVLWKNVVSKGHASGSRKSSDDEVDVVVYRHGEEIRRSRVGSDTEVTFHTSLVDAPLNAPPARQSMPARLPPARMPSARSKALPARQTLPPDTNLQAMLELTDFAPSVSGASVASQESQQVEAAYEMSAQLQGSHTSSRSSNAQMQMSRTSFTQKFENVGSSQAQIPRSVIGPPAALRTPSGASGSNTPSVESSPAAPPAFHPEHDIRRQAQNGPRLSLGDISSLPFAPHQEARYFGIQQSQQRKTQTM